ncbi:MAG: hypothetical protein KF729_10155 [Sandaracinaceae bacterium]|nr:hypothetical protein [Sandaracinaceae bacterium]
MSRPRRLASLAVLSALLSGAFSTAMGQDRGAPPSGRDEAALFDDVEGEGEGDQNVDSQLRTEGGEKVKVYRFSGLDLEGRLKSPQLLYFLNRMRAEFDRPRLPHRSFIPELSRSAQGKALR